MRRVEAFKGFTRVRFFSGRLLSADDLAAERSICARSGNAQPILAARRRVRSRGEGGRPPYGQTQGSALYPRGKGGCGRPWEVALPKNIELSLAAYRGKSRPGTAGDGMQAGLKELSLSVERDFSEPSDRPANRRAGRWASRRFRPRRVT